MGVFHGPVWNTTLAVLRDPIFGLGFGLLLAVVGSRIVKRTLRALFYAGSLVAFTWLVTHNNTVADIAIGVLHAAVNVVVAGIIAVAFVVAILAVCVLVMFLMSKPSSRQTVAAWRSDGAQLTGASEAPALVAVKHLTVSGDAAMQETSQALDSLQVECLTLLEEVFDGIDDDNPLRVVAGVLRAYFSGLAPCAAEITRIHRACNAEIAQLASIIAVVFPDAAAGVTRLQGMAGASTLIPDKDEWPVLMAEAGESMPYAVFRLVCLRRDWREVATILYKRHLCAGLLEQYEMQIGVPH
jgi:hypothetical protein